MNDTRHPVGSHAPVTPKWAVRRDSGPIIAKVEASPKFEVLESYERKKPRPGEPMRFALSVVVEPTGLQSKRALVASPGPGWSNFEIFCDEGTMLGGTDTAPPPLAYFTSGIAFCLLTHLSSYIGMKKLNIDRIKIELRAKFMTTMGDVGTGEQGTGTCEGLETFVIIDSPEPAERVKELVDVCAQACMAMQAIRNAVPTLATVIMNNQRM